MTSTPMPDEDPQTQPAPEPETEPDEESDPALDDTTGGDWSDEGGAMPQGPATDPEDA